MEDQVQQMQMMSLCSSSQEKEASSKDLLTLQSFTNLTSSDEYDTDLEHEENPRSVEIWAELYLRACQQMGTVPVSYFINHMKEACMDLSHYGLGPQGTRAISVPLLSNTYITHLDLEDNWIQPEGINDLAGTLKENCYIQELNLSNNHLGVHGSEVISRMLLDNISLQSIKLAKNEFDDESAKHFAEALSANFRVTELDLSHNEFCEKGGEHLGQLLAANEGLQVLDLSWNHIRLKGAIALSAGLRVNGMLKVLNLSHNGFANEGALALGEALRANSSLLHLDVSCNRISNEGMRLLCKGLECNDTLQVLKLSRNPLSVEGAIILLNAISKRPEVMLEEVDISNVLVNERFLSLLETASVKRPKLRVLYAGESDFTSRKPVGRPDPMSVIQKHLDENKLRLLDFFRHMDKEGTMRIPVNEFRKYILQVGIPLDGKQIDALVERLDKEQTGSVDYRDLVDTRKEMMKEKRKEQRRRERRERQERQRSQRTLRSFHRAVRALTPPPPSRGALGHNSNHQPKTSRAAITCHSSPPTQLAKYTEVHDLKTRPATSKIFIGHRTSPTATSLGMMDHSTVTGTPHSSWYEKGELRTNGSSTFSWSGVTDGGKTPLKPQSENYYHSQGSLESEWASEPLTSQKGSPSYNTV
ncbi:leucine-rich repeat-containing protein 74A [Bombina bombina]|uniref:leucine-rich repeat-containing protein 74A n=1 Tax=Bombina bombina TaxID=8345 RepID=UPI00235B18B7|nr:leucine-rich repeat-containing protein 74A [Bombina bombina]